jgi:hypothetical protein
MRFRKKSVFNPLECTIKPLQYCDLIGNQIEKHPVHQQTPENRPSGHASEYSMSLTGQEEY